MTNHSTSDQTASEALDSTESEPAVLAATGGLPRWVPLAVGFAAVVAFLGFLSSTSGTNTDGPDSLDQFTFQAIDGESVTLADFEGPLVVNYFASWCGPCRAELPEFEKVSLETAGEILFIGVSRDNVTDSWRSLIEDTGVTFPTVYEGNVQGSFVFLEANSMPTTVFVSADGTVERIWSGAMTDDKLRELIAEHLT